MAVEIKELVIRAVAVPTDSNDSQPHAPTNMSTEQMQRLIQICVDEVLKVLDRKDSR